MIEVIEDHEELIDLLERFQTHLDRYHKPGFEDEHQRQRLTDAVEEAFEALRRFNESIFGRDEGLGYRESGWSIHHQLRRGLRGTQEIVGGSSPDAVPAEVQEVVNERDRLEERVEELEEKLQKAQEGSLPEEEQEDFEEEESLEEQYPYITSVARIAA